MDTMSTTPVTIGRIVIYRSRTGNYDVPAIVTATISTLYPPNVEKGFIEDLDDDMHVHLSCFTPGQPGRRHDAPDFKREDGVIAENTGGIYQEWNVAYDPEGAPGSWRWPERA
jgi:hypothetical protein